MAEVQILTKRDSRFLPPPLSDHTPYTLLRESPTKRFSGRRFFFAARSLGSLLKNKNGQEGQKGARRPEKVSCPFLPFLSVFALKTVSALRPEPRMN
jgi:hypothetical protein